MKFLILLLLFLSYPANAQVHRTAFTEDTRLEGASNVHLQVRDIIYVEGECIIVVEYHDDTSPIRGDNGVPYIKYKEEWRPEDEILNKAAEICWK